MTDFKQQFRKFDTFSETIYLVRLAQDARAFENKTKNEDGSDRGDDIVLTFCDNSRFENTEDMWIDARVARHQRERARGFRKGDIVQIKGKLRFKRQDDGNWRGKIYDAIVSSFVSNKEREDGAESVKDSLVF